MKHLTNERLSARLDGALSGAELEAVERHLAACEPCRHALAALAEQDTTLRPALDHDPGDAYFESFAARVEDRIRAAGQRGEQARQGGNGPFSWLQSPRRLAWLGAVAMVVVGAGIVLITSRDVVRPTLDLGISDRVAQEAAPAPTPVASRVEPAQEPGAGRRENVEREDATRLNAAQKGDAPRDMRRKASGRAFEDPLETVPLKEGARDADLKQVSGGRKTATPAEGSAPAPGLEKNAAPQRLREVARNAGGEDVPVKKEEEFRFAPPPASPGQASDRVQVQKPRYAEPALGLPATLPKSKALGNVSQVESVAAGEVRLCGQVLDPSGRPVAGAQVILTGSGRATSTDVVGRFCLAAPAGDQDVSAMAIGFVPARQQVRVAGESSEIRLTLRPVAVLEQPLNTARTLLRDLSGGAKSSSAVEPRDVFATLPDTARVVARIAERLSAEAAARRSAEPFDAAAAQWERALGLIGAGPAQVEARYRLGEARFRAWDAGATAVRKQRAIQALTAFLGLAPTGGQREQATRWLERARR